MLNSNVLMEKHYLSSLIKNDRTNRHKATKINSESQLTSSEEMSQTRGAQVTRVVSGENHLRTPPPNNSAFSLMPKIISIGHQDQPLISNEQTQFAGSNEFFWPVNDVKARLFVGRQPGINPNKLNEFFNFLRANKISQVIDLRPLEDLESPEQHYRSQSENGVLTIGDSLHIKTNSIAQTENTVCYSITVFQDVNSAKDENVKFSSQNDVRPDKSVSNQVAQNLNVTHFTNWPDFGVISKSELRTLANHLIALAKENNGIYVHCRGGIGRTGTLVTYAQVKLKLDALAKENQPITSTTIDAVKLDQLRANRQIRRPGCVETLAQENLIRETLLEDFLE